MEGSPKSTRTGRTVKVPARLRESGGQKAAAALYACIPISRPTLICEQLIVSVRLLALPMATQRPKRHRTPSRRSGGIAAMWHHNDLSFLLDRSDMARRESRESSYPVSAQGSQHAVCGKRKSEPLKSEVRVNNTVHVRWGILLLNRRNLRGLCSISKRLSARN